MTRGTMAVIGSVVVNLVLLYVTDYRGYQNLIVLNSTVLLSFYTFRALPWQKRDMPSFGRSFLGWLLQCLLGC